MEISDLISIGVIKKTIGNGGLISAIPDNSFPEYYCSLSDVFIVFPDETVRFEPIDTFELRKNIYYIKLMNINSKEEAHELVKAQLMVAEDMLPVLEEDEFYPNQLIDYTVVTNDGVFIGKVSDILSTPGQDILIIPKDDKEIMIPFCDEFIIVINHDEKKIMIEPIEGLLNAH